MCVLIAHTGFGISYEEWSAPSDGSSVEVRFNPVDDGSVDSYQVVYIDDNPHLQENEAQRDWEIPSRPIGGVCGEIHITRSDAQKPTLPLTCQILFSQVLKDDLLPPASNNVHDLYWDQPMDLLDKDSPLRVVRYLQSYDLSQTNSHILLPLELPFIPNRCNFFNMQHPLLSCRAEITDVEGNIIARRLLIECFAANHSGGPSHAWVMDEPEADRLLREFAGIQNAVTVNAFPPQLYSYFEVAALWMSTEQWEKNLLPISFLRKLLLMGVWIYGRNETIAAITDSLDLPQPGAVLLGGIEVPNKPTVPAKTRAGHYNESGHTFWENYLYIGDEKNTAVLENRKDLFQPLKRSYISWSLAVLLGFGLFTAVGLPMAFVLLKGAQRVKMWWYIPILTVVFALVGWIGGQLVLNRIPRSDVTEYRLAYAGWPEIYCQTVARMLHFDQRDVAWQLPPDGSLIPQTQWQAHNTRMVSCATAHYSTGTVYALAGLSRGSLLTREFASFRKGSLPVQREGDELAASAPLRAVHIRHKGKWYSIGQMLKGHRISLADLKTPISEIKTLPAPFRKLFERRPSSSACSGEHCTPVMQEVQANPEYDDPFASDWILVAISENEHPAVRYNDDDAFHEGRVIWIIQLPSTASQQVDEPQDVPE
jgi:hypothetical protein